MKKKIVALTTTASTVAAKQDRVLFFFKANDIQVTLVDATQSEQRKQLLAVSGLGPSYPQFFIYNGDDNAHDGVVKIEYNSSNTTFLGNYNDIVDMNDGGMITKEYLGLVEDEKNTKTTITTTTVTREALPSDEDDTGDAVIEQESKEEEERCCWGLIPINRMFKKPTSALKVD
jgi:hypothetical protein